MNFILGLDKPVRSGQTQYFFIVMEIRTDWKEEVTITCSEEERESIADGSLKEVYSASICNTIARLFKYIVGINIIIPGEFKSSQGDECIQCTVKANQGHLYFLSKSMIYIYKPVIFIQLNQISKVLFHRVSYFLCYI